MGVSGLSPKPPPWRSLRGGLGRTLMSRPYILARDFAMMMSRYRTTGLKVNSNEFE